MSNPIQFDDFFRLLNSVKLGNSKEKEKLDWLLAEYEHAKDCEGPYDELGQIFCHIGIMELYEYVGTDNIKYIHGLDNSVWNYLEVRYGETLDQRLVKAMQVHSKKHGLISKVSSNWKTNEEDIIRNLEGLAKYVSEGIIDIVK